MFEQREQINMKSQDKSYQHRHKKVRHEKKTVKKNENTKITTKTKPILIVVNNDILTLKHKTNLD